MKNEDSLLAQLIQSFKILPGIGEKSAQRMAFYLLEKNREGGNNLAKLIATSMEQIRNCSICRNLTEEVVCEICSNEKRDKKIKPKIWQFWENSELNNMFQLPDTKKNKILYNAIKNIFEDIFDKLDIVCIEEKHACFLAGEYFKKVISKRRYFKETKNKIE